MRVAAGTPRYEKPELWFGTANWHRGLCHRPSVCNSARFARGEPASRLIGGHIFVRMTRVGIYSRTNDTHETGPPKSEQLPVPDLLDRF